MHLFAPTALFFLLFSSFGYAKSQLDDLIGPEIYHDKFYDEIYKLSKTQDIHTILEIGSSSGEGSTQAFITGIHENPNNPTLFCMEVSEVRFNSLQKHYENDPLVKCYNVSSIPISEFPSEEEVKKFFKPIRTSAEITTILGWLRQDIEYLQAHPVPQNGIQLIKEENGIDTFDMVLIDGSEFTGKAEFGYIYGAKFILLDDINTFKNNSNYKQLLKDSSYVLISRDIYLRNGYAIFRKKEG